MFNKIFRRDPHIFEKSSSSVDLKKQSLRGGAITLTSQGMKFVLQLGSTIVLARILTPQDYGINAMAVSVTGFASMLSSLGLSAATIQRTEINHEQVSALFWINVVFGAVITLIVASLSPLVAWFYNAPELAWVMFALSFTFFITGLSVQHSALLNRQMRFYSLAKIQIFSMLSGIVVAIVAAKYGFGYWALVFNTLTYVSVGVVGTWFACRWVPGRPRRATGVGSMVKFGSDLMGFNVINYFSRNLDNVLIGRYYGSGALGFYSKAYQLLMMPITNLRDPMNRVALPALSKLQKEPEQYRNYYIKYVSILAFLSIPIVVFMYVSSDRIISLVLGEQWMAASDIFKILAFVGLIQAVASTRGVVLLSTGKSRRYLWWGLINAFFTIAAFIIGLPWGAKGVAMSYAGVSFLLLYPSLLYAYKDTPVHISDFSNAVFKPFFASLVMGLGCFFLLQRVNSFSDIVALTVCFAGSFCTYFLALIVISGGSKDVREYYSYVRLIFTKK